jgi:heptosyltransferase-1
MERLLIVRLSSMGDIIHALPAATALRHAFPAARIGWVVEERWAELLCTLPTARAGRRSPQRPLVDHLHLVNTKAWRRAPFSFHTWQQAASVWSDMTSSRYEAAVDFQGSVRSAVVARLSGATVIYGPAQPRENAASMCYSRQVQVCGKHVIDQNLSLASATAGRSLELWPVDFPIDPEAEAAADERLRENGSYAILNPGAGWGAKQWPAERYGEVARMLSRHGITSFLNYGPGEEEVASAAHTASGGAGQLLSCSLTHLISITRRARLFIGGDTGPLHLAAALGVPVVAIFGPTDPARNGPFGTESIVLRHPESPTTHSRNSEPHDTMLEITSDYVMAAARHLLASASSKSVAARVEAGHV